MQNEPWYMVADRIQGNSGFDFPPHTFDVKGFSYGPVKNAR